MTPDLVIHGETGPQRVIGYVLDVSNKDGGARCWLDLTDDHLNRHGVLHGGIATVLLDSASGATGSMSIDPTGRAPFLTMSLTTNFLAPARARRVTATGRITGGGKSTVFIEAQLVDETGQLIATSTGVFRKVPDHRRSTEHQV
ncbi:PaaI family thioesterase [Parasedimentitalea maritima]|uniref:Hotdog fold thioesterase n=1 Tax=Parasedimentitalea maritima TaxID=2578117 RepID=A0A6A4RAL2_9RHOB|nr:PaaI family thioesterase [Zongyanglinia marina]KAE9627289.1 hotdog fold thioesterase [Zongyanglinia marina]